ncbi:uncharacterized protein G2W53_029509 [Senna tora]|uniref:Uncharacterized protein n=1 Tax=Senna tora TaxID=362788 RepID=A0A834W9Q4_9FABA|nr:uncharacterized protein G2W53_029509 [Senna tora]
MAQQFGPRRPEFDQNVAWPE